VFDSDQINSEANFMQSSCAIKLLAALMVFSFAFAKEANSASPTLTSAHIYDGDLDGFGFTWLTNTYGYYLFLAPGFLHLGIAADL